MGNMASLSASLPTLLMAAVVADIIYMYIWMVHVSVCAE